MVERRFPRGIDSLGSIHDFVQEFCRERRIGGDRAFEVDLVVEELFTNLVKHQRGREEIALGLEGDAGGIAITLIDRDVDRFDPNDVPDDTERRNQELRPGGRGIRLVRELVDELRYDYRDRTGTITAITRWSR